MSLITVGTSAPDAGAATGSRTSLSADPEAFAASLRSATEGSSSVPALETLAPSETPTSSGGTPVTDAAAITAPAAEVPAATAATVATAATTATPLAVTPDPLIAPVPVPTTLAAAIATPATPPEPSTTGAAAPRAVSAGASGAGEARVTTPALSAIGATAVADAAAPTAADPIAPVPAGAAAVPAETGAPPRRGPRHAGEPEATPTPVAAVAAAAIVPAPVITDSPSLITAASSGSPALAVAAGTPPRQSAGGGTSAAGSPDGARSTATDPSTSRAAEPVPILTPETTSPPVAARAAVGTAQRPATRVTGAASASTQSVAATLGQTAVTQTIASHPTSGDAPAAAPQTAPPLNQQVAPAVLNLRSAGAGTHILTLTVSPESVGPVTVRAHITGDSMRVELSAPTDQGRDALLSMLPDLKRDLSQGGMNSALSVASPNSDAATAGGQNQFGSSGGSFARDERPNYFRTAAPPGTAGPSARPASVGATTALDVLA